MEKYNLVTAPYPSEGILLEVKTPTGEIVSVVSKEVFVEHHQTVSHPLYRQICYIDEDKIVAGAGYAHKTLHPVVMLDFSLQKQVEPTPEIWK